MDENIIFIKGVVVRLVYFLPFDEVIHYCELESREEVKILSGRKIDLMRNTQNNECYVSEELFKILKNEKRKLGI